jgi:uncharacterized protein (DUF1501 family)
LNGDAGISEGQFVFSADSTSVPTLNQDRLSRAPLYSLVRNLTKEVSDSVFSDTWNGITFSGIEDMEYLRKLMLESRVQSTFSTSATGKQLEYVARIISSRAKLNSSLHLFYVKSYSIFDTHAETSIYNFGMADVDSALKPFVEEMKLLGVWDKVTVVIASEFGRNLHSNVGTALGSGTDHGWAGNAIIAGGSVRGGQIFGKYPSSLRDSGETNLGNGVLLPTTPWESMWNAISQWIGISDDASLNKILPNRPNFLSGNTLFNRTMVFRN